MKKNENNVVEVNVESKPVESESIILLDNQSGDENFGEKIDAERKGLFDLYRKTTRFNSVIMFGIVIIFVVSLILMRFDLWGQIVAWVLIGISLVSLIVYFVLTKNKYPKASKDYFKAFWTLSNQYLFNDTVYKDCKINSEERYVMADVISDRVYKDVIDIASRNIVRGEYKEKHFTFGELAFYRPGAKKNSRDVMFVGRHLELTNDYHFEGRFIVNIRGEKQLDLPNDIEDLTVLEETNNFVVYGPEGSDAKKVLGKTLIDNLKSIECTGCLLNVNIVFWPGHTAAYLSYDDSIVAIPFDKSVDINAYNQLKHNIRSMMEILGE